MKRQKILVTTGIYPPEIGGPATYTALMEKELPKHGIEVFVLPFRIVRHLPIFIRHFLFLCKVLSLGIKADLLYAQDPVSVGFPTMIAAKILGKPFLMRVAGDYAWEQASQRYGVVDSIDDFQNKKYGFKTELLKFLQRVTTRMADKVITPSKYFRNLVAGWNLSRNNVITIYNGIDFREILVKENNYVPKTIVSAGRLVPWKGFDCLIEMIVDNPEWKLLICGDGPDKERLQKLIIDKNAGEQVNMLGGVKRVDMIKKIQQSEIFILNTSFESFSFVVVEAMFAGTPVITTNIGNLAEIIEDGKEGFLVEPNNVGQIMFVIDKLQNKDLRIEIIKKARQKSEMFSLEKTLTKTSEVIRNLIDKK